MHRSNNPNAEPQSVRADGQAVRNLAVNQPLGEIFDDLSRMISEEMRILDLEMRAAESALLPQNKGTTIRFLA